MNELRMYKIKKGHTVVERKICHVLSHAESRQDSMYICKCMYMWVQV